MRGSRGGRETGTGRGNAGENGGGREEGTGAGRENGVARSCWRERKEDKGGRHEEGAENGGETRGGEGDGVGRGNGAKSRGLTVLSGKTGGGALRPALWSTKPGRRAGRGRSMRRPGVGSTRGSANGRVRRMRDRNFPTGSETSRAVPPAASLRKCGHAVPEQVWWQ